MTFDKSEQGQSKNLQVNLAYNIFIWRGV